MPVSGGAMTTARDVGERVLLGLAKGRARAIAQAKARGAARLAMIVVLANEDLQRGRPSRGRASRIARKLHGLLSERHVKRILDRLSSVSDPEAQTAVQTIGGPSP